MLYFFPLIVCIVLAVFLYRNFSYDPRREYGDELYVGKPNSKTVINPFYLALALAVSLIPLMNIILMILFTVSSLYAFFKTNEIGKKVSHLIAGIKE